MKNVRHYHIFRNTGFRACCALGVCLALIFPSYAESAPEKLSYDRFTPALQEGTSGPQKLEGKAEYLLNHALVWPLDIFKKGMDETLNFIEHHRVYDKLDWLYEQFKANGIYTKPQMLSNLRDSGPGAEFNFSEMARLKQSMPHLKATGGIGWIDHKYFRVHSELGVEKKTEVGPYGWGVFNYEDRPREDFFGIGPDTSRGDGASYHSEITTVGARGGYSLGFGTDFAGEFLYENANIGDGKKGNMAQIGQHFPGQVIPGLDGADFLVMGAELTRDTRDFPEDPHKGSNVRLYGRFYKDVGGERLNFMKLRFEASKYVELFSDRQVIAARLVGEHNLELGNHNHIPFFHMARLGGNGLLPSLGDTMRGYVRNRFYADSDLVLNFEYRYEIWHYKNSALDAVIFCDEGQAFNEIGNFEMKDFRTTVGGGLRFKLRRRNYLSFETAWSNEGFQIYARTTAPF